MEEQISSLAGGNANTYLRNGRGKEGKKVVSEAISLTPSPPPIHNPSPRQHTTPTQHTIPSPPPTQPPSLRQHTTRRTENQNERNKRKR